MYLLLGRINIRNFDSSTAQGKLEGYTHQKTIDIIKDGKKATDYEIKTAQNILDDLTNALNGK